MGVDGKFYEYNNEYFPELVTHVISSDSDEDYGILNVSRVKSKNVLTGFIWKYTYFDSVEGKLKVLSSYDLKKLRKMVEDNYHMQWVVIDIDKARKSYDFNRKLQEKRLSLKKEKYERNNKSSASGVKYVYRNIDNKNRKRYFWTYRGKHKSLSSKKLKDLRDMVLRNGFEWQITNSEVYYSIIDNE